MTNDPFAELPATLRSALVRRGFEELTLVQQAVVEARAAGRDLRISSQTGSGKTVAIGMALAEHFGAERAEQAEKASPDGEAPSAPPSGPRRERGGSRTSDGMAHPTALVIVPTRELAAQVRDELDWLYADLGRVRVEVVTGGTSVMGERRALSRGDAR